MAELNPAFLLAALAGVAPPALVALGAGLAFLRRPDAAAADAGASGRPAAVALGLGFLAALITILGHDVLMRPNSVLPKLGWVALAGSLWGLLEASPRLPGFLRPPLRLALSAGLCWWLLSFMREHHWEGAEVAGWLGALSVTLAVVWSAVQPLAVRSAGLSLPLALALLAAGTGGALNLAGSASLAQLAGALGVGTGVLALVAWRRGAVALGRGGLAPYALLLGGAILGGRYAAELPPSAAWVLAGAPLALWAAELCPAARPRTRGLVRVLLMVAAGGVAAWLAYEPAPANPYY